MDLVRATELIENFAGKRVAVIGDFMLDSYVWGSASRISQEAPVPVVAVNRITATAGGAGNVIRNLSSLGANAVAFGALGDDSNGRDLREILAGMDADTTDLILDPSRTTTEKRRIVAGNQQIVRVDTEDVALMPKRLQGQIAVRLQARAREKHFDAIIIEDYGKGNLTRPPVEDIVNAARELGLPVAIDPHPSNAFNVKGATVLTPNRAEAFALAGQYRSDSVSPVKSDTQLREVARQLRDAWDPAYLLVTLGPEGMALFDDRDGLHHVPTLAREVFDVSGAGDTVIASFVLALLGGASGEEAAIISNHAAGVVVGKVGTASVNPEELLESFVSD